MAEKKVKPTLKAKSNAFLGTGRRKKAIARVRLIPNGNGTIVINNKSIDEYFDHDTMKYIVRQPLALTGNDTKYDVYVNVVGGGY
ncbi:MAG: 30S ribosomal protein S9, partial [Eubacteriales bacterium]|nr:30S ribosomal protein S9 [Eubacteriales bacterium]